MAKWNMPHEVEGSEVLPMGKKPVFIMPHEEVEATPPTEAENVLAAESPVSRGAIGAGQRLTDIGLGLKQRAGMIRNLLPGEPSTWPQDVAKQVQEEAATRGAIDKDPYAGLGKGVTDLAFSLLSPSAKVLPALGTGAALELAAPTDNPTWGDAVTTAGKGALVGGLGSMAMNSAATMLGKSKNAVQGRFANPEIERRFRIFQQNDVPASLGDLTQSPGIMGLENMAQYVPASGRKKFLEQQSKRLGEVVEGAPERIAGPTSAQSKEDVGGVLANSIKAKYKEVKTAAKGLYDDVQARVEAAGDPPITPAKMSTQVNTLLTKYPSAFAKLSDDPDTVRTLETIASGVKPGQSPILGANGQPILTPPKLTFAELRQLDSDLGSMIRQGRQLTARGDMNNKSFNQLVEVQKALREDIADWSHQVGDPGIASGVSQANKYFRENVQPFRKNQLTRKVIQDENYNPDNLANSMFRLDSPYLSGQAKQFLTPEGIQAGRFHLMNQAKKKAMDDTLASGYSPSRFMKGTELGETGPKLFSPDELGQLEDLQTLIGSSRRAASYSADPATGNRLLGLAPLLSMKIPLAARAFSTLSQSEAPMRFMLSDPRLYTGNGALGKASESLLRKSGAGLGVAADDRY